MELEVETLQKQIEMLNGIIEEKEADISDLKNKADQQDSSLKDEYDKIRKECKKKSLHIEELALDLSNIEKEKNSVLVEKGELSDRLSKTLEDMKVLSDLKDELQATIENAGNAKELQDELDTLKAEYQEDMDHIKGTLKTYLQNTPKTTKENEAILSVVYSMLSFTALEQANLDKARQKKFPAAEKAKSGKGIFGMFGGKNK